MRVILDDLSSEEFFEHGGNIFLTDGTTISTWSSFREFEDYNKIKEVRIGLHMYEYNIKDSTFYYKDYSHFVNQRDPYGIKNVNFTLIDREDNRWDEFCEQRKKRGFDSSELWSLDSTISRFIYPRLKAFYNNGDVGSYPAFLDGEEEWVDILKKMVDAFELIVNDETDGEENGKIVSEGLDLFREYFFNLWD